jgi:hypothetical protein
MLQMVAALLSKLPHAKQFAFFHPPEYSLGLFESVLEAGEAKGQYAVLSILTHLFCCDLPALHRKFIAGKVLHRLYEAVCRPGFPFPGKAGIQLCYLLSNLAASGFCYEALRSPLFEAVARAVENRELQGLYCLRTMLTAARGEEWAKDIVGKSRVMEVLRAPGESLLRICEEELSEIKKIVAAIDKE